IGSVGGNAPAPSAREVKAGMLSNPAPSAKSNSASRSEAELINQGQNFSPQASTGTTALFTITGSGAGTANGDYVSDNNALDTSYHYFIEVPTGLSRFVVDLFDADVGLGGANR